MAISATQTAGYSQGNPNDQTNTTSQNPNTQTTVVNTSATTNPTTFLYDVGLQNVYQDYQKAMTNLNQREQQSLQDAYYIREMSKKYLGEYASNVGIGDVSGNLLDIYGQYQQTVAGIGAEFGAQEMGLQQQYDTARRELEAGKMGAEMASQQAQGFAGFADITSQTTTDVNGNPIPNPFYQENFNPSLYNLPEGFDINKQSIYSDMRGTEFFSVAKDIDAESADKNSEFYEFATRDDIMAEFKAINGENASIAEGDIVPYNGVNFVLRNGKFYRLQKMGTDQGFANFQRLAQAQQSSWVGNNIKVGTSGTTDIGIFRQTGGTINQDQNIIFVNLGPNLRYTNADESGKRPAPAFDITTTNDAQKEIIQRFKQVHGQQIDPRTRQYTPKESVVEYKGKLYYMNAQGQIWTLRARYTGIFR